MSVLQNDVYAASYTIPGGNVSGSTISLTVTAPDGTTSNPTPTQAAPSTASITAGQVGTYLLVWKSTGSVVDVYVDQFTVVAPSLMLLSLSDLKDQLNITQTDTTYTAKLLRFLADAKDVVEGITGPIVPQPRVDVFDGGGTFIVLPFRWVKSITSITETVGAQSFTLTEQPQGVPPQDSYGYTWDRTINKIVRRYSGLDGVFPAGTDNVSVSYTLGMTTIPQIIQDACGEIIRHWWSHGQTAYTTPFSAGDDAETPEPVSDVMGFLVPRRVMQMLQPYEKRMGVF